MGMYDNIEFECECPQCGKKVTDFQSKDGPCAMYALDFWEVDRFYSSCNHCGLWLEFTKRIKENKKIELKDFTLEVGNIFHSLEDAKEYFKNPINKNKELKEKRLNEILK